MFSKNKTSNSSVGSGPKTELLSYEKQENFTSKKIVISVLYYRQEQLSNPLANCLTHPFPLLLFSTP